MAAERPTSAAQVEDRIKVDVQREAPDSNPYLTEHYLRSLIAALARRLFDFYLDGDRLVENLFPDTADDAAAARWGNIFVGPKTPAANASGELVATGTAGGVIGIGVTLTAGSQTYTTTSGDTITAKSLSVLSLTRSGSLATVKTASNHGLSSFVPVTISGADQTEYNVTDAPITVTGLDTFTYTVAGSPVTPATGTVLADFTTANVTVNSVAAGSATNLDRDTAVTLQSPIVNVDDTLYVTFGAVGGGTDAESTEDFRDRYLEKTRDSVAHFNVNDIKAKAKEIAGVTRVFVESAGTPLSTIDVSSITRSGNVATVTTVSPHGFDDGQTTTITGAIPGEYNVVNSRIIIESTTVFHYVVMGSPATPATGLIKAATSVPLGQLRTFFMRDNDADPIPSPSEVATVQAAINAILPANTSTADNIVAAPTAVPVNYTFTALTPNTSSMQSAVTANLKQFHAEQTVVGQNVDRDAYRAAIINTVDPDTGDTVETFDLASPTGDITIQAGEIATQGVMTF